MLATCVFPTRITLRRRISISALTEGGRGFAAESSRAIYSRRARLLGGAPGRRSVVWQLPPGQPSVSLVASPKFLEACFSDSSRRWGYCSGSSAGMSSRSRGFGGRLERSRQRGNFQSSVLSGLSRTTSPTDSATGTTSRLGRPVSTCSTQRGSAAERAPNEMGSLREGLASKAGHFEWQLWDFVMLFRPRSAPVPGCRRWSSSGERWLTAAANRRESSISTVATSKSGCRRVRRASPLRGGTLLFAALSPCP